MRNEMLQSSIIFDAAMSARSIDENGFLHVAASHITKTTVNPYYGREIPGWREAGLEPDRVYYGFRAPEELKKSVSTWTGLPLHIEHHIDSAEEPAKLTRVGAIGAAFWNAPYVDAYLTVWDQNAIEAIEDGSFRELSCAYRYEPDFTPGTHEGVAYDFVMRNIRGNHVALVEEGRAGPDVVVADAAMHGAYDDRWITVKPNGPDKKGRPALIDENGTVKAGMGGKFNGRNIDDIPRGKNPHPVTEEKYQARQQRQAQKQKGSSSPLDVSKLSDQEIDNRMSSIGGAKATAVEKEPQLQQGQTVSGVGSPENISLRSEPGYQALSKPTDVKHTFEENGRTYHVVDNPLYIAGMRLRESVGEKRFSKIAPAEMIDAIEKNRREINIRADKADVENGKIVGVLTKPGQVERLLRDVDSEIVSLEQKAKRQEAGERGAAKRKQAAKEQKEAEIKEQVEAARKQPAKQGQVVLAQPHKIIDETNRAVRVERPDFPGHYEWLPKSVISATKGYVTHVSGSMADEKRLSVEPESMASFARYVAEQRQARNVEQGKINRAESPDVKTITLPDRGRVEGYKEGDIVQVGNRLIRLEKKRGSKRIDEDTPSIEGAHLLGHEGERAEQWSFHEVTQGTLESRNPINEAGQPKRQQENRAKGQPKTTTQTKKSQVVEHIKKQLGIDLSDKVLGQKNGFIMIDTTGLNRNQINAITRLHKNGFEVHDNGGMGLAFRIADSQSKKNTGSVSYNENGQPIPPKRPDSVPDGYWNGKFYSGNRIYVDNRAVNLSDDQVKELKQWQADYAEYKKARQADTQAAPKSYLNVRYEDRQKAKEAGAKWDSDAKKWYWDNRNGDLPESLKQWSGEAVKTNGPSSGTNTYASSSGSAKNLSEYDRNDLEREARKWDQLYNEGGEGFNPYRAEIERRRFTRPNEPMTASEAKRFWSRGGKDASPKYAEDSDNPAYYPDMQTLHRSSHKNITSNNFLKGGIMGKLKRWFRGAFDDDPGIEKKEVELAQAIIDLHKTDPVTGEIVDVTEDEDKAEEIRELVDELSAKLDPEDVKKLTDALTDLAYSKATGDEDPDRKDSVVTIDEELREAMDKCGLDSDDPDDSRAFAEGVKYGESLEKDPAEAARLAKEHESEGMKRAMDSCGLDAENPMDARAFAEGVKYGEKKEKTEPGKLAREHEREGELRALGKDEDKSAAITRILDNVPGLTPEQRKKLFDALQDLAYAPATGDEDMDEPKTAQDRALRRRASRSFVAMDAARIKASAIAEAQEHMRGLSRAVRDVRGLVGDLDPLSFDCASDVYGYALKQSGVNPQAYPRQAWRGMVDVMRAKNTAVFPGGMARDAATSKMTGKFTGLNNITIAD